MNSIIGLPFWVGMIVGGVALIVYSTLGGLYSVVWTDLFQFFLFVLAMLIVLPITLNIAGGISSLRSATPARHWELFLKTFEWRMTMVITMFCAPFVRQYYYQRMFAAKSPSVAKKSLYFQALAMLIVPVWAALMGMAVYKINPGLAKPEMAFPWVVSEYFPKIITVIMIGGLLAAIMSSADTILNAASLTFTRDIWTKLYKKDNVTLKEELKIGRISTIVIGIFGILVGMYAKGVLNALLLAWKILAGGLAVPIIMGYFWSKSTANGVLSSIIVGLLSTLIAEIAKSSIPSVFVGLACSFVTLLMIGMFSKKTNYVEK